MNVLNTDGEIGVRKGNVGTPLLLETWRACRNDRAILTASMEGQFVVLFDGLAIVQNVLDLNPVA